MLVDDSAYWQLPRWLHTRTSDEDNKQFEDYKAEKSNTHSLDGNSRAVANCANVLRKDWFWRIWPNPNIMDLGKQSKTTIIE